MNIGKGKVWLVGAGPSDAGLLTIKAKDVIQKADVVVYDRLIGPSIMMMIPKEAEQIDVGKRAGNHTMPQEEINQVLLEKALEGKRVVRLKGGDPFLFGRGGEELELLVEHQIPFEVVPGVTSAISVPAYNGIPVTHRDCTSSLHIITGHKKKGVPFDLDFEALVRTNGTLVFLMGVGALPDICEGLLAGGMDADMPAAILQQGTTANQKKIIATVSTLPEEVKRQGIETPAIIVVGKVCAYADEFSWYEKLPLFGAKIIVTRPKDRISTISDKLRELGAQVVEIPAIRTVPVTPNPELDAQLDQLSSYQYLVFTSPAGVQYFMEAMAKKQMDFRKFPDGRIAVIGQGTAKELQKYGVFADLMPIVFDAAHLGQVIGEDCEDGDRILIPRARIGSQKLIEEISKRKQVQITDLPIYDTEYEQQELIDEKEEFEHKKATMAIFTSASTVRGFAATTQGLDYKTVTAACIGKQTKAAADALGMRTFMAKEATIDALVELAVEINQRENEV
jgi:uroporphyrinogen III methyltransferase/synthase